MMDSFEFNKIAGAVLGTLLFTMALMILSEALLNSPAPAKPGYDLPSATAETASTAPAAPPEPLPVLLAKADPKKGANDVKICTTCHNFEKGAGPKTGPALFGVVDRPKGTFPGFGYSDGMKSKGGNWTFDDLNTFLTNPSAFVPGTKMTYRGEPSPEKRADIIDYLDTLADNPVPLPKPEASNAPAPAPAAPEPKKPEAPKK
jgi:cytochrome c